MSDVRTELGTRAFLARVQDLAAERLAVMGLAPRWRQRYGLLQAAFGTQSIHYEVWLQRGRGQVEVGLHFEADARQNGWLMRRFGAQMVAVQHELGPGFELEQWTASWGRIHTYLSVDVVDEALAVAAAQTLADSIRVLQPRLEDLLAELGAG